MRIFGSFSKSTPSQEPRILFVSHDASRTGAPQIALNLLKQFAHRLPFQFSTLLMSGGALTREFAEFSQLEVLNTSHDLNQQAIKKIETLLARNRSSRPLLAICNSMESRSVAKLLAAQNIPVLFLVHELPSSYSGADYQSVVQVAGKIVFPCQAVLQETENLISIPASKKVVLSQGLLNENFGHGIDRTVARQQIRKELNLPPEAKLVLGCGTLDLRKGIDHFAAVARQVIKQHPAQSPHFVWLGGGDRSRHSIFHYIQLDLKQSAVSDQVHFIGERDNVVPYFFAADLFLMTSRVDPFPCVVHEAMAAGAPVITFGNNGGAAEAIAEGAGYVVDYADHHQMAQLIHSLLSQPEVSQGVREKAKQRVRDDYCFADYADQIMQIAGEVAGRPLREAPSICPPATIPFTVRAAA